MMNIQCVMKNIVSDLTGMDDANTNIIRIHNKNLNDSGDLSFPLDMKSWKYIIKDDVINTNRNIFEYFLKRHNRNVAQYSEAETISMGFNLLQSFSKLWLPSLTSQYLNGDRFHLFLHRYDVFHEVITSINQEKSRYGQQLISEQTVYLVVNEDPESELTTARLHQIKYACEKLLMLHGYEIKEDNDGYKYCFTTKPHEKISENYHRYVCGVVNNAAMKTKETDLTCEMYRQQKMNMLNKLNEEKVVDSDEKRAWLEAITEAIITFEFLSVKPSCSPSVTDSNERITNEKGGVFVLYNVARIKAILEKFNEGQLSGIYPELWDFNKIDFTKLHSQEEWEIVYHYLFEYPELIRKSVRHVPKHEIYPNLICSFLIGLCKKFSKFYRKERILTDGSEHLIPTMMARVWLLKAIQIVMTNCMHILGINEVTKM